MNKISDFESLEAHCIRMAVLSRIDLIERYLKECHPDVAGEIQLKNWRTELAILKRILARD